jgi:hypothetical protein
VIPENETSDLVQVGLARTELQQLQSVLPWLLQALDDRPNLTAKQRARRATTRTALSALQTRIEASGPQPLASAPADATP